MHWNGRPNRLAGLSQADWAWQTTVMKHPLMSVAVAASLVLPASAEEPAPVLSPGEVAAAAPAIDWVAIAPSELLVMDLAPDAAGKARRVVIQLMPAPFSQGWIGNIRKLAAAHRHSAQSCGFQSIDTQSAAGLRQVGRSQRESTGSRRVRPHPRKSRARPSRAAGSTDARSR